MYDSSSTYGASYEMTTPQSSSNSHRPRYQAIKEHLFSRLNDEGVILSLKNGKYYGLNSVGLSVWTNIQKAATFAEIEAAVMEEYDVDEETCRREISLFLEKMLSEELIETVDDPTA